ncbi:NHS-like protein 3 isoform X1 [Anguilla rostrata]|uniref:NHS-like protein 3 isoform X1 n=1 Tax=Anguilla rostrata TaxID=7938 RepID=UPI0030CD66AD
MPDVFLAFSAIALALSFVNPAHVLSSNTPQSKPYEDIWGSKWVVPRINHHRNVVPSTDDAKFLVKGSPYSSIPSTALPKPDAEIQCGAKDMTLKISKLGSSPLHVNQNESWVAVFQKLPRCSSRKSRHRRQLPPHFGCVLSKPDGPATFPVRVAGTPLVIGCPFPPRDPTVECTTGLQLRLNGVSPGGLKIKVMGYWYPLMVICRWCGLSVELQGGELSIKAPFKGSCTETKDGVHSISLRSGDTEMVFTCSPPVYPTYPPYPYPTFPPYPYPTYPAWLTAPPTVKPPLPWPIFPPPPTPPKTIFPWPGLPYHVHPSPAPLPTAHTLQPPPSWPYVPSWPVVPQPAPAPAQPWQQPFTYQSWYAQKPDGSNAGQVTQVETSDLLGDGQASIPAKDSCELNLNSDDS